MWISVDDVVHFTGLKPQHLNLDKSDTVGLEAIVSKWIVQSQSLINSYCHRKPCKDEEVSDALCNICLRLTSNMVSLAIQKRDNPIIKVNDWTIQSVGSDVFTDDLKDDLKPFVNDSTNNMSSIGVLAITGADPTPPTNSGGS